MKVVGSTVAGLAEQPLEAHLRANAPDLDVSSEPGNRSSLDSSSSSASSIQFADESMRHVVPLFRRLSSVRREPLRGFAVRGGSILSSTTVSDCGTRRG